MALAAQATATQTNQIIESGMDYPRHEILLSTAVLLIPIILEAMRI